MNEQQLNGPEPKPSAPELDTSAKETQRLQLVSNPSRTTVRPVAPPPTAPQQPSPPQPAETEAEEAYDDYSRKPGGYNAPKRHIARNLCIMLLVLLVAGAATYWFVLRTKPADTAPKAKQPAATQQTTPKAESQISSDTKEYSATNFSLTFTYPKDWTVTETAGSGRLMARSPKLSLKDATGATRTGQVVFMIRDKQQAMPEFDAGNAVAAIDSQKITYAQPSGVQRGSTYISFLQYASSNSTAGIDGIYITGDTGYQKEQAIPKADFIPVDPIISLAFEECEGGTCKTDDQDVLSLDPASWNDKLLSEPLTAILKSLVII